MLSIPQQSQKQNNIQDIQRSRTYFKAHLFIIIIIIIIIITNEAKYF